MTYHVQSCPWCRFLWKMCLVWIYIWKVYYWWKASGEWLTAAKRFCLVSYCWVSAILVSPALTEQSTRNLRCQESLCENAKQWWVEFILVQNCSLIKLGACCVLISYCCVQYLTRVLVIRVWSAAGLDPKHGAVRSEFSEPIAHRQLHEIQYLEAYWRHSSAGCVFRMSFPCMARRITCNESVDV